MLGNEDDDSNIGHSGCDQNPACRYILVGLDNFEFFKNIVHNLNVVRFDIKKIQISGFSKILRRSDNPRLTFHRGACERFSLLSTLPHLFR